MRDLIQRDPREPFEEIEHEELVCRCCGEPAMTCDCDGYRTANLVAPTPMGPSRGSQARG